MLWSPSEALIACSKAVGLMPNNSEVSLLLFKQIIIYSLQAHMLMGRIHLMLKNLPAALAAFDKALKYVPKNQVKEIKKEILEATEKALSIFS